MLALALLTFAAPTSNAKRPRVTAAVNRLAGRLHSADIKGEVVSQAARLASRDPSEGVQAVNFFWDLCASDLLEAIVADEGLKTQVRTRSAEALLDLSKYGNVALAGAITDVLESSNVLVSGGLEDQITHARFQYTLAELLRRITERTSIPPLSRDEWSPNQVKEIVKDARKWIEAGS